MIRTSRKAQLLVLMLLGVVAFASACSHQKTARVGSHKVTVARHGFTNSIHNDPKGGSFSYEGTSLAGVKFKVSIVGDLVKVNDRELGVLRPGDSVFVGDDGVRVNSMDYGESEKYLRANGGPSRAAVK